ncbi:MAG: NAD-dependent dihydropyrimidine dehydrogenase subunit PreA [Bacteroidales bacterium]|nr:NAD-dependent dihydropyrimidine dehydrogenase subunit PreA [Bacteroidales bacterium]
MKPHIRPYEEAARCLLCDDAPCTKACGTGDPARAVRAVRFDNAKNIGRWISDCTDADLERAEQACIHYDQPIRLRELLHAYNCESLRVDQPCSGIAVAADTPAPSLAITFCGIPCENPFFLASSAVCTNYEMVARAFDMGWAGVFYKTICKQDIYEVSPRFDAIKEGDSFAAFRNMEQLSENPYDVDFDILHRLKQNYPTKIVVASIMGQLEEEWIELAQMAESAGCDAVELNFSCPQMRLAGMGSDVGQDHELVAFYTSYVKQSVKIPVIAKMTPNITDINRPAMGAFLAGADGISAINTIKSVTMTPEAEVSDKKTISGLSGRSVKPIALRYILNMAQNPFLNGEKTRGKHVDLSGIGGIETWRDALEFLQLGCRNVQVCTAVMQYGYRIIDDLLMGLQTYMTERGIESLDTLVAEQVSSFVLPSALDRDTIVYPKFDRTKCIGCGRCAISCSDGGHQALRFDTATRQPHLIGTKCVGCHLCRLVCPTGSIGLAKRVDKKTQKKENG